MLALLVGEVAARQGVMVTEAQVKTVCGKALHATRSGTACSKACGANGEHQCEFTCDASGCNGYCHTCKTTSGGKDDPVEVVKKLLSRSY
jgi:hypothetical protein